MDVTNPKSKDESKFSFYADWSMPLACKPGWWTGTTDGKISAGVNECSGYSAYKMHCDGWEKWQSNYIVGEKGNPVVDPNGGRVRNFRCWFPYLGTGGDKAPPGSRRGIEGPHAPAREISSLRKGWRALFGR